MKNIFRFLLVSVLFSLTVFPQSSAIYLSGGYDIPTATSVIGTFRTNDETELNSTTYAKGFIIQGGYQLIVNNNFVFDLNINYQFGLQNEIYNTTSGNVASSGNVSSYSTSNISVSPSVGVKIDVGNFSPYAKFGVSVNFITMNTKWESGNIFSNTYKREYTFQNDVSLGILGGIGVDFRISQHFIPYIESQLNSITYYPNEVVVTEFYADGRTSETTYQLVDKIDGNNSEENISLTNSFPYSSIGFIVGIRYVF